MKALSPLVCASLFFTTLLTAAPDAEEWTALFDGGDLSAWKGYQMDGIPGSWTVADGILGCSGETKVDLITKEAYENFELWLVWKTEVKGNSGILILGDEEPKKMWNHAPEIQIFDATDSKTGPEHKAGAVYALYPTKEEALKPAGEWNDMRIKIVDSVLTVTLNDVEVVTTTIGGDDWNERVAASKFSKYEGFGKNTKGHIGLQDHGQKVWFKSIKIRQLD